jgi:hypothetical protein
VEIDRLHSRHSNRLTAARRGIGTVGTGDGIAIEKMPVLYAPAAVLKSAELLTIPIAAVAFPPNPNPTTLIKVKSGLINPSPDNIMDLGSDEPFSCTNIR